MKDSAEDGDRLDFVVPPDKACTLLTQTTPDALHIRENHGLRSRTSAHQCIENYRLEKRETECVSGEGNSLPWMGRDEIKGRQAHAMRASRTL